MTSQAIYWSSLTEPKEIAICLCRKSENMTIFTNVLIGLNSHVCSTICLEFNIPPLLHSWYQPRLCRRQLSRDGVTNHNVTPATPILLTITIPPFYSRSRFEFSSRSNLLITQGIVTQRNLYLLTPSKQAKSTAQNLTIKTLTFFIFCLPPESNV